MGVQGLKSYIENNKDVLKNCHFRNSKLIIDGCNLYYSLYFNDHLDQVHGGDYQSFEKLVSEFFRTLTACNIQPYVVLDGGTDTTGKKIDTLLKRAKDRIRRADALSRGLPGETLPILTKTVFKQVLHKLEVPFVQCLAEADSETAALANEWRCPVLSNDSDFYIFNISAGFLPISQFKWQDVIRSGKKSIPAKMFNVKHLCAVFNHMNKDLLPLFATILGNDYIKLDKEMFPDWMSLSMCSTSSVKSPSAARIDCLLTWLSYFSRPEAAIQALECMVHPEHSASICMALARAVREYRLPASSIARFFSNGDLWAELQGPLKHLPRWMLKPLAEGKLNSIIIDVLTLQSLTLSFQVEDSRLQSSNQTSRPIRQAVYGLLLSTRQRDTGGPGQRDTGGPGQRDTGGPGQRDTGGPGQCEVTEYDRQVLNLRNFRVAGVVPGCAATHLHLDTLWEAPRHVRLQVLMDTLQVTHHPDSLSIPVNLHLAMYVTCYWLKHAQPEPKAETYWALLIGFVYGELSREPRTAEEVGPVLNRLKNLRTYKDQRTVDLGVAHAYSQWQCCMRDSIYLSQLLCLPVPECTWLYSGPLVHHAASSLNNISSAQSLLADAPYAVQLFRQLRDAVERELDLDLAAKMRTSSAKERANASMQGWRGESDLSRMFAHLMFEEEDDGDYQGKQGRKSKTVDRDETYECQSIRTRHKTKSRTCARHPKSSKFDRVCFD
ncbi:single-strand DNA endonuclease ASTE1 [Brachyhypopomus gauderio]|uniref:single-strand DNA endonuclease ASTE1 n=1 Tax=Brachyhypopomus gauderio TaxID=698409 RepID=UPI0040419DB2